MCRHDRLGAPRHPARCDVALKRRPRPGLRQNTGSRGMRSRALTPSPASSRSARHPPSHRPSCSCCTAGSARSTESGERKRLAYRRMLPFARMLARRGLAVYVLRYRVRGLERARPRRARRRPVGDGGAGRAAPRRTGRAARALDGRTGRARRGGRGERRRGVRAGAVAGRERPGRAARRAHRAHRPRRPGALHRPGRVLRLRRARQGGRGGDLPVRPARRRPLHAHPGRATGTRWCGGSCSASPVSNPSTRRLRTHWHSPPRTASPPSSRRWSPPDDPSDGRRGRLRGRRADRRLPAAAPLRRHAVRGRRPARRPRPHPRAAHRRRRHGRRRHRLHRAQPPHLPEPAAAVRRAGGGDAGVGHVDERALRGLRPGVRGRPRARRPVPAGVQPRPARLPADARRGACASTGTRAGCWPTNAQATSRSARSSPSAATRATSSSTSCCRSCRRCGRRARRCRSTYPARYLFAFLHHHGMLAVDGVAALAHGGRRVAALRRGRGEGAHRGGGVDAGAGARADGRGVEIRDDADTVHHADVAVVATHPDQALALLAAPDRRRTASCWARSATPQRHPAPPRHLGAAAAGPARGRRGTTSRPAAGSATRRCW